VKKIVEKQREERLQSMLIEEVNEADKGWLDFEMEETQLKLDLADMVLSDLVGEVVEFLKTR
jgi:hypothetical protein